MRFSWTLLPVAALLATVVFADGQTQVKPKVGLAKKPGPLRPLVEEIAKAGRNLPFNNQLRLGFFLPNFVGSDGSAHLNGANNGGPVYTSNPNKSRLDIEMVIVKPSKKHILELEIGRYEQDVQPAEFEFRHNNVNANAIVKALTGNGKLTYEFQPAGTSETVFVVMRTVGVYDLKRVTLKRVNSPD